MPWNWSAVNVTATWRVLVENYVLMGWVTYIEEFHGGFP
jgi:hypothetical protein